MQTMHVHTYGTHVTYKLCMYIVYVCDRAQCVLYIKYNIYIYICMYVLTYTCTLNSV